jgi:hypothetical protein
MKTSMVRDSEVDHRELWRLPRHASVLIAKDDDTKADFKPRTDFLRTASE